MKILTALQSIAFSLLVVFVACDSTPEIREIPNAKQEGKTVQKEKTELSADKKAAVSMNIEGMVCAMGCAAKIESEVAKMEGVAFSKVDYESATANFEFDKTILSAEDIISFIGKLNDGEYKALLETPSDMNVENEKDDAIGIEIEVDSIINNKRVSAAVQEDGIAVVREKMQSMNFPKLLTYFLKSLH